MRHQSPHSQPPEHEEEHSQHNHPHREIDKDYYAMKEESTIVTNLPPLKVNSEEGFFTPSKPKFELKEHVPNITIYRKHYYQGKQLTQIYDGRNQETTVRAKGKITYILSDLNQISQMGPYLINVSTLSSLNEYTYSDWKELTDTTNKCYCSKSSCEQNYCSCYASNKKCNLDCACSNCKNVELAVKETKNNLENMREKIRDEKDQQSKVEKKKERIRKGKKKEGHHHSKIKGCNCKKAGSCSKQYCSCYRLGINCGEDCNCTDCQN